MAGNFVDNVSISNIQANTSADNVVLEQFGKMSNVSTEVYENTKVYLNGISDIIKDLVLPDTSGLNITTPEIPVIDVGSRPSFGSLTLPNNWPTSTPSLPTLLPISAIPEISLPSLTANAPVWSDIEKPVKSNITEPGDVPVIVQPEVPVAPAITLPDAPNFADILLPAPPSISIPVFDSTLPEFTVKVPEGFSWEESPYNSEVWNDLLNNVLYGLKNGGTGLAVEVEADIWANALLRQQAVNDKLYKETETYFAARGFRLPSGAFAGRLLEISSEIARNNSDTSQKIAIAQADLAQKNTQFIMEKAVQIEGVLRNFHDAQVNRSLQAAQVIVNSAVAIYNAQVQQYNTYLEQYKAEAQVYEAQVRAALTEVEIFKAQVESAKVTAEVQKTLVEVYQTKVAAVETHVRLYTAQMDAVKIALQIEMSKLEAFKMETEAYVARLDAEKSQFQVYGIEVEAEKAKASVYSEQVRAYIAEVEAKKTELSVYTARSEADIQQNQSVIEGYKAELAGYSSLIQMLTAQTGAVVEGYKADISAYNAETVVYGQYYDIKVKEIEASIQQANFNLQKAVAEVEAITRGYTSINELALKGQESLANVGSQLTASAWNAVNTSATIGESVSRQFSESQSLSNSLSEQHSYNEE